MTHDHSHPPFDSAVIADRLRTALETNDVGMFGSLLAEDVRWGGEEDTPETCHTRDDVLRRLAAMRAAGMQTSVLEVVPAERCLLLGLKTSRPLPTGGRQERTVFQVMSLQRGLVTTIRGYPSRTEAAEQAGLLVRSDRMQVTAVVPILNVSSLSESFAWFEKLGWTRKWEWAPGGGEPTFGAVSCDDFDICLCRDGQGGRGQSGVWVAIWIDDVDRLYERCQRENLAVIQPPRNESWGVRELHLRHPDGHVLRMSQPGGHEHGPGSVVSPGT